MTSTLQPMWSELLVPGQFLMDRWQLPKKRQQPQLAPWWGVTAVGQRLHRSKEKVISSPPPNSSAKEGLKQMGKALWEKILLWLSCHPFSLWIKQGICFSKAVNLTPFMIWEIKRETLLCPPLPDMPAVTECCQSHTWALDQNQVSLQTVFKLWPSVPLGCTAFS